MPGGWFAQRVNDALRSMADAIQALADTTQQASTTTGALPVGNTDVVVTWPKPWPDSSYGVYVQLVTGVAGIGAAHVTIKAKTATDVTLTVGTTTALGGVTLAVLGLRK